MVFFILGTHPELSEAEIFAVIGKKTVIARSENVLILDDIKENLEDLQERLAGTIKIGYIVGELLKWNQDEAAELIASLASEAAGKNKISFGVSAYGFSKEDVFFLGKLVKKQLKSTERPVRFVTSKEIQLSSVIVQENGLLSSGGEFILIRHSGKVFIGQTHTVQAYRAWSDRDFGRPARDAKSGMLPPKLARLMINLSGVDPKETVLLDPFCGSGTVLAEALLLGFKELIGSDISKKAVDDTQENLSWLINQLHLSLPNASFFISDAQHLTAFVREQVGVIVTETFLGEPQKRPLTTSEFKNAQHMLFKMYEPSFETLSSLLPKEGKMVLAVPVFRTQNGYQRLEVDSLLESVGFQVLQSFLYHRPDQIVGREIFVLSKT